MQSEVDVLPGQRNETAVEGLLDIDLRDSFPALRAAGTTRRTYYVPNKVLAPNSPVLFAVGIGTALSVGVALALWV